MNSYGSVDPWGAVYFGVCFLALISPVRGLCVDAPTSGLQDLCSCHLCGDSAHKVFCRAVWWILMVKALFWAVWSHSLKRNISLQVHISAWNSGASSQGATVPMPADCQDRRLLWLLSCHLWSLCCVLGFQCLQEHELEAPHHILAQELLSQFPCVCLEASRGSLCTLLGKETPCLFWPLHRQLRAWDSFIIIIILTLQLSIFLKQGYIS